MASEPTLSTLAMLASEAEASSQQFNDPSSSISGSGGFGKTREQMRKYYLKALHKVVDESDIVILVLDARDPEGCRSRLVEEEVRRRESEGKKLVFVLNKIGAIYFFLYLDSRGILTIHLPRHRSNTEIQCPSMVEISPPFNPYFAFPFFSFLSTPTDKYFLVDCTFSPQAFKGIQTEGWEYNDRCRWLSECRKE
jgi:hypothetical protein